METTLSLGIEAGLVTMIFNAGGWATGSASKITSSKF
jgi:hypothetical protein